MITSPTDTAPKLESLTSDLVIRLVITEICRYWLEFLKISSERNFLIPLSWGWRSLAAGVRFSSLSLYFCHLILRLGRFPQSPPWAVFFLLDPWQGVNRRKHVHHKQTLFLWESLYITSRVQPFPLRDAPLFPTPWHSTVVSKRPPSFFLSPFFTLSELSLFTIANTL